MTGAKSISTDDASMNLGQYCTTCATGNRDIARYCKRCGALLTTVSGYSLDNLIGMHDVQREFSKVMRVMARMHAEGISYNQRLHTLLLGNTGTGKTTLVNTLARAYSRYGVTKRTQPIFYDAANYSDFTKDFEQKFRKAKGGILCIENVQKLISSDYSQSVDPLDRLLMAMSSPDNRQDPIIILSGHTLAMRQYLTANEDVRSRFPILAHIPDFNATDVTTLTTELLDTSGFSVSNDTQDQLLLTVKNTLKNDRKPNVDPEAKNAWLSIKLAEECKSSYFLRDTNHADDNEMHITPQDVPDGGGRDMTREQALQRLHDLVGMDNIKSSVQGLIDEVEVQQLRHSDVGEGIRGVSNVAFHIVLTGNPGTGKTTVARLLGEILRAIGVLELGHVIEVDRAKMVGQFKGHTAPIVEDLCDQAQGGILFIDEAYTLKQGDEDSFGQEAIDKLLKRMEDDRGKFVVVIAGYPREINAFLNTNPGLQSRFDQSYRFHMEDYTAGDLNEIFKRIVTSQDYALEHQAEDNALLYFESRCAQKDKNFGNGREARTLFENCRSSMASRIRQVKDKQSLDESSLNTITAEDIPSNTMDSDDLATALGRLDSLIGLDSVKAEVRELIDYVEVDRHRQRNSDRTPGLNLKFVFTGNPGTGKTEVANIMGSILKSLGILRSGHTEEVTKADLVGKVLGESEAKTNAVVDRALGGVLFIDEAYTLASDQYGRTAIETLLKRLDQDRNNFVAIVAGYSHEMEGFFATNPGLGSRFTSYIDFPDYSKEQLLRIFDLMATKSGMTLEADTREKIYEVVEYLLASSDNSFANARTVRNLFEHSIRRQSTRVAPLLKENEYVESVLTTLLPQDIEA